MRTFSNEPIQIEEIIRTPGASNGLYIPAVIFTDVADGLKTLIGCDHFDQLGPAVTQFSSQIGNQVNNILPHCAIIICSSSFPKSDILYWKIKNYIAKSKFHKHVKL